MKTIRKNSKKFNEILSLGGWIKNDLSNHFVGEQVAHIPSHCIDSGKLVEEDDKYTFDVHSNLWFELSKKR